MTFERDYSTDELDLGVGMVCHPCNGHAMDNLHFLSTSRSFYLSVPEGGWDWDPPTSYFPRISEGKGVRIGDPYPAHWQWDPYSGTPLLIEASS